MRALSIATIREEEMVSGLLPGAIRSSLRPLQALIAAPTLLFLTALTAMLFCHPDVSFHRLNRVTFALLVVGVVGRAVILKQEVLRFDRVSWPMIALTAVVLISLVGRPIDEDTWGVLAAKYVFPFTLFHLAQLVFTEEPRIRRLEVFALVVLAYLSFTAIVFLLGLHNLVFPKFILDPNLGYHAERARGPFLQAVANGVSLNMLALVVLHGYRRASLRSAKTLVVLALVPIAILATMTRAVWLSFAGSLLGLVFVAKNVKSRLASIAVVAVAAGGLGVVMSTTQLGGILGDRLQDSGPVEFRQAVYAGSWKMFLDRPVTGWGFHQMPVALPKYVGELHDKVLYPHNTYLEILVENGLLGLSLYAWLMWELWRLGRGKVHGKEARGFLDSFRRWWPILLAVYWANAAVVVMSYQFVNGILFTLAGIVAAQRRRLEVGGPC
ncbi:MAG TPA: O-antigen ligase family protein [Candidatus Sulfotelmatobacter sp.]|nr:O-antigen ligase family protein [Candidatus Sulfotelmatobacter sp.]